VLENVGEFVQALQQAGFREGIDFERNGYPVCAQALLRQIDRPGFRRIERQTSNKLRTR